MFTTLLPTKSTTQSTGKSDVYKTSSVPCFADNTKLRSPLFSGILVTMNVINVFICTIAESPHAVHTLQALPLFHAVFLCW